MPLGEPHKPVEHKLTADELALRSRVQAIPGAGLDMSAHPTDFKWDEHQHPRDDRGRFGEGSSERIVYQDAAFEQLTGDKGKADKKIQQHFLDKSNVEKIDNKAAREYKKNVKNAFKGFSSKAIEAVINNTHKVKIVPQEKVDAALVKFGGSADDGFAAYYNRATREIVMSSDSISSMTIAHEAAHAIDQNYGVTDAPAWKKIFKEEFTGDKKGITWYSRTNRKEAFAECMYYSTHPYDQGKIADRCPKAWKYLLGKGIIVDLRK